MAEYVELENLPQSQVDIPVEAKYMMVNMNNRGHKVTRNLRPDTKITHRPDTA
jgi:hypothetical protein